MKVTVLNASFLGPDAMRNYVSDAVRIVHDTFDRAMARRCLGEVHELLVLWSILRWESRRGRLMLQKLLGPSLHDFEDDLDNRLEDVTAKVLMSVMDFKYVCALLTRAEECAQELGHSYVGTEHFIFALAISPDPIVHDLFAKYGINRDRLALAYSELGNCNDSECMS